MGAAWALRSHIFSQLTAVLDVLLFTHVHIPPLEGLLALPVPRDQAVEEFVVALVVRLAAGFARHEPRPRALVATAEGGSGSGAENDDGRRNHAKSWELHLGECG